MSDANNSRPKIVLGMGIAIACVGLGFIAYIPKSDPLLLGGSTATVMVGYALGRWAVHRMADNRDD